MSELFMLNILCSSLILTKHTIYFLNYLLNTIAFLLAIPI